MQRWAAIGGALFALACGGSTRDGGESRDRPEAPSGALCRFGAAASEATLALVGVLDEELYALYTDGSRRKLFEFSPPAYPTGISSGRSSSLSQRGSFVAAVVSWRAFEVGKPWRQTSELVLSDLEGRVLQRKVVEGLAFDDWAVGLAVDGVATFHRAHTADSPGDASFEATTVFEPDGNVWSTELSPLAEPWPGAVIAVTAASGDYAFLYARTGAKVPLSFPTRKGSGGPLRVGEGLVYLSEQAGAEILVIESPLSVRTIALPSAPPRVLRESADDRIVRLTAEGASDVWTVDIVEDRVMHFDPEPPPGQRALLSDPSSRSRAAPDGALIAWFRDDHAAGLFHTVEGPGWSRLGRPVTGVDEIGAEAVGSGTYVMRAAYMGYFTPPPDLTAWQPPPPDYEPTPITQSTQLVNPASGVMHELRVHAYITASRDGGCVAYWQRGELRDDGKDALQVFDMKGGNVYELFSVPEERMLERRDVVWVE